MSACSTWVDAGLTHTAIVNGIVKSDNVVSVSTTSALPSKLSTCPRVLGVGVGP